MANTKERNAKIVQFFDEAFDEEMERKFKDMLKAHLLDNKVYVFGHGNYTIVHPRNGRLMVMRDKSAATAFAAIHEIKFDNWR